MSYTSSYNRYSSITGSGGGGMAMMGPGPVGIAPASVVTAGGDVTWRQVSDKVKLIASQQIEDECRYLSYTPFTAQDAATVVSERVMIALRELCGTSFKLIVNTSVLQKTGAGLHTVSSCFWDAAHDGSTVCRWENDSIVVLCTVFGIRLE